MIKVDYAGLAKFMMLCKFADNFSTPLGLEVGQMELDFTYETEDSRINLVVVDVQELNEFGTPSFQMVAMCRRTGDLYKLSQNGIMEIRE